ncbi:MAG: TraB/GumN family protein, partial [Pseudomonadota bacterium]
SIPPVVSQRIAKADRVFREIVADDEARMETEMMSNPALVTLVDGPGLREQLTATEWSRLTELLTPLGLPEVAMDRMRPWLLSILIALPMCELLAVQEGGITLDRRVEMLANASGVPVGGLETAEEALAAFLDLSEEDELQFLKASITYAGRSEDLFRTTRDFYLAEDIQKVWEFPFVYYDDALSDGQLKAMQETILNRLLRDRNLAWMRTLVPALARGNAVVAVGALHLTGEIGLLRLLEDEGFTVRRLAL